MNKIYIGFWAQNNEEPTLDFPDPRYFVVKNWDQKEKQKVISYLKKGDVCGAMKGCSYCRICDITNGSEELTDGKYLWPSGFVHYLEAHNVKPIQEFIDHVLSK
mgnify:CR=1 FL=1